MPSSLEHPSDGPLLRKPSCNCDNTRHFKTSFVWPSKRRSTQHPRCHVMMKRQLPPFQGFFPETNNKNPGTRSEHIYRHLPTAAAPREVSSAIDCPRTCPETSAAHETKAISTGEALKKMSKLRAFVLGPKGVVAGSPKTLLFAVFGERLSGVLILNSNIGIWLWVNLDWDVHWGYELLTTAILVRTKNRVLKGNMQAVDQLREMNQQAQVFFLAKTNMHPVNGRIYTCGYM